MVGFMCGHDDLTIADWKTGSSMPHWARLQTAGYSMIFEEFYKRTKRAIRRCAVHFRSDGTYRIHTHPVAELHIDQSAFLDCYYRAKLSQQGGEF